MLASRSGPTAAQLLLGARLRELRVAADVPLGDAAEALRISRATLRRMESGQVAFRPVFVRELLALYGGGDDAGELLAQAEDAGRPAWWHAFGDVLPPWLADHLGLEEYAQVIRLYAPAVVPELLQTPAYAEAVQRSQHPDDDDARIGRRLALLARRQEILTRRRPGPPVLWALIEEAALRRSVGGPAVMREQLAHLRRLAAGDGVTIRVVPMHTLHSALLCGPVQLLRYRPAALADRVLLRTLNGTEVSEAPDTVRQYLIALDSAASVPDSASVTDWAGDAGGWHEDWENAVA